MKKKTNEGMKIVIYDVAKGNWEINELKLPLVNQYTPGFTTVAPLGVILSAPTWFGYVLVGLRTIFRGSINYRGNKNELE